MNKDSGQRTEIGAGSVRRISDSEITVQEAIDLLNYRINTASTVVGSNGFGDMRLAIKALEKQSNLRNIAGELMKKNYQEDEYNYFQKGIQALVIALEKEE